MIHGLGYDVAVTRVINRVELDLNQNLIRYETLRVSKGGYFEGGVIGNGNLGIRIILRSHVPVDLEVESGRGGAQWFQMSGHRGPGVFNDTICDNGLFSNLAHRDREAFPVAWIMY